MAAALLVAMMVLTYNRFLEPSKLDRLDQFCSDCLVQVNSPVQFDLESPDLRETQKFIRTRQVPSYGDAGFSSDDANRGLQDLSLEGTMGITDLLQAAKREIASPVCH